MFHPKTMDFLILKQHNPAHLHTVPTYKLLEN